MHGCGPPLTYTTIPATILLLFQYLSILLCQLLILYLQFRAHDLANCWFSLDSLDCKRQLQAIDYALICFIIIHMLWAESNPYSTGRWRWRCRTPPAGGVHPRASAHVCSSRVLRGFCYSSAISML